MLVLSKGTSQSSAALQSNIVFFLLDFWIFVGLEPLLNEKGDSDSGDGGRLNATLTDKDVKGTM